MTASLTVEAPCSLLQEASNAHNLPRLLRFRIGLRLARGRDPRL